MVAMFVENIQALMEKCRELENQHNERLMDVCIQFLNKVVKSELSDDVAAELQEVSH